MLLSIINRIFWAIILFLYAFPNVHAIKFFWLIILPQLVIISNYLFLQINNVYFCNVFFIHKCCKMRTIRALYLYIFLVRIQKLVISIVSIKAFFVITDKLAAIYRNIISCIIYIILTSNLSLRKIIFWFCLILCKTYYIIITRISS